MADTLRVLLIEDSEDDALLLLRELRRGDWNVVHHRVQTSKDMTAALESQWDILISDYSMPQFSGIGALALAQKSAADLPFILVSGTVGEEVAVEAMKAGANDYLFKGNLKRLVPAVKRELREAASRREACLLAQELHRRDQQLADAQRLARLGTWHIDADSNVTSLSEEAFEILGRPSQPAMTFGEFLGSIHPEDQTRVSDALQNAQLARFAHDVRVIQPGGTMIAVHIRGDIARNAEGWPIEAAGMIQDITERKRAEQDLQQAHDELAVAKEAADAANRAKDHFLAVLSHELRTPLTPVLALASELESRPDLPADVRHDLATIRRNVSMEARLIDDLLDLTRIVRNKMELHLEVVDAHHVLQCALGLFEKEIAAKGVELLIDLSSPKHHLWADPDRLEQVFMNLLSNAVKFTPPGGRIKISSHNDERGWWRGRIEDNGIGIESDVLQRLFNAFEQGEVTVSRRFGGLGLGLSISKTLLEMQQGRIKVNSDGRDKGATFEVELATVSAEPKPAMEASSPLPAPTAHQPALRVLLVEDHDDTRRVIKRLLEGSAYSVACAASVKEAMALAATERFHVLLSDIGLPDGSGHDVLKYIQGLYPIRGIAMSGFGQAEDIRRSREAGFEIHLTKPIDFSALASAIQGTKSARTGNQ